MDDRESPSNLDRAKELYDSPDRREVEEANKKIKEESGKPRTPLLPGEKNNPPD
ncbi:hypothetical protein [Azospirillum halopraeferens]|uniref:hypothetical protein n=1 Tax=Azospirillum halopraeferens TaxID=34010 RepID=UPI0003FC35DB|nr:hypothetical protein [Azospirillum halopraeferens]